MRIEELPPGALAEQPLRAFSGEPRLQYTAAWLDFVEGALPAICGPGARLSALAAREGGELLAAIPMVRTSPAARPRPFPWDLEDAAFGLWIRNLDPADRKLRARALASRAFDALLGALDPSLRRGLVLHAPLSPVSDALVAPRLDPAEAAGALRALLSGALRIAAEEQRCAFIPRLFRQGGERWNECLTDWIRVPTYSSGAYLPGAPAPRSVRQMIRRNRRLMEQSGVTVEITGDAPPDVPFGALFEATARRHRDPAPLLDDRFFRDLAARFAPDLRFLCARREGLALGFLAVLRHGASWEAFKCGTDRALAGPAPVYLDLVYGRLRELAAAEGAARVDLGPGDLDVKRHYGAEALPVDCYLALPPGFRGGRAFTAYLAAVGEGIARHERGEDA